MLRKIIFGTLIIFSSILLGLSIAGIGLIWMYKEPFSQAATARLKAIDNELGQAQTALQTAEIELARTLRTVEAAEASLITLKADFAQAKILFGDVNGALDKQLIPGLKSTRENISQAKTSLQDLQKSLATINALPFINFNLPGDQLLENLITSAGSLDSQISQAEDLVKKASTFMGDASYLMGGDFTETKTGLQNFIVVVKQYDQKLTDWRAQIASLLGSTPGWIETASIVLTVFLLWFGFSQVSVILHGLTFWRGGNPQPKA
jgi:disulfide bond formation protein DsbB